MWMTGKKREKGEGEEGKEGGWKRNRNTKRRREMRKGECGNDDNRDAGEGHDHEKSHP